MLSGNKILCKSKIKIIHTLQVSILGSAPYCSTNINSFKMCPHQSSYQIYETKIYHLLKILSKAFTSKLVNTFKLNPTEITHLLFSEKYLVFLLAFNCNSNYYKKRNLRHLIEYNVPRNINYCCFGIIGNGSPGEIAEKRNDSRR